MLLMLFDVPRFQLGPFEAPGCDVVPKNIRGGTCPQTYCTLPKAYFGSPNLPNLSSNTCRYVITTTPGSYVWFQPLEIFFEGNPECTSKLSFVDNRRTLHICGRGKNVFHPYSASRNVLAVEFIPSGFRGKFFAIYEERYFETSQYDDITEKDQGKILYKTRETSLSKGRF